MTSKTAEQIERRRQVRAKCYAKNREKNLAYAAEYREANSESIKAAATGKHAGYSAKYRQKNYEKCLQMTQAWKDANREKHKAYCAAWTKANPLKNCLKEHRRRARKAKAGGSLSVDIVETLMKLQRGRCACCGKKLNGEYHIDHIVPLALGGENSDLNVQLLLPKCNWSKGAKDPITYMQKHGRLL